MTSISATSSSNYQSPLQQLQAELQSEINSGAINSSDQGALSSALNDIDSSLQSGNATGSTATAAPPTVASPKDIQSKVDSLIAGEVSNGKLTTQQATELKGLFQSTFANGPDGSDGQGVSGGPNGSLAAALLAGGSSPVVDPSSSPNGSIGPGSLGGSGGSLAAALLDPSSSTGGSNGSANAAEILQQFLQSVQNSAPAPSYDPTGNSASAGANPLLINYKI